MIHKYIKCNPQQEPEQEAYHLQQKTKQKCYKQIGIIKNILPGKGNRFDQMKISMDNRFLILTNMNSAGHEVILFSLQINDKTTKLTEIRMKTIRKMNFKEAVFFKNSELFMLDFQKSLELYQVRGDACFKIQIIQIRNQHQHHAIPCLSQNEKFIYSSLDKEFQIFSIDSRNNTWKFKYSISLPQSIFGICANQQNKEIIIQGPQVFYMIHQMSEEKWILQTKIQISSYYYGGIYSFQRDEIRLFDKIVQWNSWKRKFIRKSLIIYPKKYEQAQFRQFNFQENLAYFKKQKSVRILNRIQNEYFEQQIVKLSSKIGILEASYDGQFLIVVILSKIHVFQLMEVQ